MKPFALLTTLLLLLTGCTGLPKGIEPVTGFDQDRYLAQKDHHARRGLGMSYEGVEAFVLVHDFDEQQ